MEIIFWSGIGILFYTYLGYGLIVYMLLKLRKSRRRISLESLSLESLPRVALLIAAYNEEDFIEEKIKNTLALDYPADKLEVIFVTDGSTDNTMEIIKGYPQFSLLHQEGRSGKIAAVKRAMPFVTSSITVLCDANTYLNRSCIKNIAAQFTDESVGAVAGEKRVMSRQEDAASASGEGFYWKYESFLKAQDAELYSVVGAAGELFAIRTPLFTNIADDTILEDFVQSLLVACQGYRVAYTPEAYASESASASVEDEMKRKIRISAGGFQAMWRLRALLNPFKYGLLTFQYISHRVLRWTLAPIALPIVFISNAVLAAGGSVFYSVLLGLQLCFYLIAGLGWVWRNKRIEIKGFFIPFYFFMMNYCVYRGFFRFIQKTQQVTWERAERMKMEVK